MSQAPMINRTSHLLFTIGVLCLLLSTGCAFSKNLLGKSNLQTPALPGQTATSPGTANPDCAAPDSQPKPTELTSYPVAPQAAVQATANASAAPMNNGTPQQPMMQQPLQQPQYVQQTPVMQQQQPAVPQQTSAVVQQPAQQLLAQPMAQTAVVGNATQGQDQTAQLQQNQQQAQSPQAEPTLTAEVAPLPDQYQAGDPNSPKLPTAVISPYPNHPKEVGSSEMTAAPVAAYRPPARPMGTTALNCPPGMVPIYGHATAPISSPEKVAECEKQVFEMNQKLSALQLDTIKATLTMEQMAEQQKQLMIDNERLRRRAEMADKRYLEELDSLSEIVGEVVSQTGSARKSSSASKPSRDANPLRPVPQSATGQSL